MNAVNAVKYDFNSAVSNCRLQLGPALAFLALTAFFTSSERALADCSPASPVSGGTVVCDGNPSGFTTSGLGSLSVEIVRNTNLNGAFVANNMGALSVDSSGNLQAVTLTDVDRLEFDNRATINGGLTVVGDGVYVVHNYQNSFINSAFSFTGNSTNIVTNDGTLNNGITINGNGQTTITNTRGASLNTGISVIGASETYVQNYGTIQSTIALGTGDDTIVNYDPGQINGSVSQGSGNDVFDMRGGRVSATVNQDAGADRFLLSGGEVTGSLVAGTGNDYMLWTGGLIGGVDMGSENDIAVFRGLTDTQLRGIQINGGLGTDRLTWQGTQGSNPQRIINWETFELLRGSQLTMNSNLTLGDSGTATGLLSIDATSSLRAGSGSWNISPAVGGNFVQVRNAGIIDLTNGSNSTSDRLQINGNYQGVSGRVWLNTVLESDNSPSDRLVISGGAGSGSTGLVIDNVGGTGAQTEDDGIMVVQAVNGGTTGADTFFLAERAAAGLYEYQLVQGGEASGTAYNWYLRNNFQGIDSTNPDLPEWLLPGGGGEEGGGGSGGGGGGTGGGSGGGIGGGSGGGGDGSISLIRPEVPIMGATPTVVRGLLRVALGTFHERHGEQAWFSDEKDDAIIWSRMFGDRYRQDLSTFADQSFRGNQWGIQFGVPVHSIEHDNGELDTFGLLAGYSRAWGDMRARNIYGDVIEIGNVSANAYSLGGYWTHTWENEAYIDAVLMHSWLSLDTESAAGSNTGFHGREWTASLEAGRKFDISDNWIIEPQAQVYWQHQNLGDASDLGGPIRYDKNNSWTGRIGVRLEGDYLVDDRPFSPFVLTNLWHQFEASDTIHFNDDQVRPSWQETSLELGAGFTSKVSDTASVYANLSYEFNLGGERFRLFSGRLGVRVTW